MPHVLRRYRWELWLFVGIPFFGVAAQVLLAAVVDGFLDGFDVGVSLLLRGIGILAIATLLGISYARILRTRQGLFPLIWGYVFISSVIAAAVEIVTGLAIPDEPDVTTVGLYTLGSDLFLFILIFPLLLWFAWRASRLSLAHAFFLIVVTRAVYISLSVVSMVVQQLQQPSLIGILALVSMLATVFVAIWLLGNFEWRSSEFRAQAVLALLAMDGLVYLTVFLTQVLSPEGVSFFLTEASLEEALTELLPASIQFFTRVSLLVCPLMLVYLIRVLPAFAPAPLDEER